jgi:hypothetical protein
MASSIVAAAGIPVRVLTENETNLVNRVSVSQGIPLNKLIPNDEFITITPYASPWYNDFFKNFIQLDGDMNQNLAMLNRYEVLLAGLPDTPDKNSKRYSVQNRKRELLIKAYNLQNPDTVKVDKVACCIIRPDNKGLFVKNNLQQLGYPKGDVEYFLTDSTDINTVYRESLTLGALRELEEETGFQMTGGDFRTVPMNVVLQYNTDTLHINNAKTEFNLITFISGRYTLTYNTFYLILYTNTVTPLTDLTLPPTAASDNIIEKLWEEQYKSSRDAPIKFNEYSKKPQRHHSRPPSIPSQKANTYLGGARRKLISRRHRTQKKRKSKSKTKSNRRKH